MDNVTKLYPANSAENADHVIEQAVGVYEDVLIIGWNKDGELDVRSNLNVTAKDALWLVDLFRHKLLDGEYNSEEAEVEQ